MIQQPEYIHTAVGVQKLFWVGLIDAAGLVIIWAVGVYLMWQAARWFKSHR